MDTYESAWDWCDVQIEDWGNFLDPDEMREFLEMNFPHIEPESKFWENIEASIERYYND